MNEIKEKQCNHAHCRCMDKNCSNFHYATCNAEFIAQEIKKSDMDPKWLIWSNEHGMWWRANENGYTPSRKLAGRYTFEQAKKIVKMANRHYAMAPNEAMVEDVPVEPIR